MDTMDINELTAKYICEQQDRLEMALYVHGAMDTVRMHLSKDIFEEVGEIVAKTFSNDDPEYESYEGSVYLTTSKTDPFWVFAYLHDNKQGDGRRRDELSFVAGVYADPPGPRRGEIREHLEAVDLETWSFHKEHPLNKKYWIGVTADHHEHGVSWSYNQFLTRAIQDRKKIVKDVADLLECIYRGVFPLEE